MLGRYEGRSEARSASRPEGLPEALALPNPVFEHIMWQPCFNF